MEKRLLQLAVTLACVVPISAGLAGAWEGTAFLQAEGGGALDSHMRYLSGLLLGIGLAFLSTVRHIERRGERFALLTLIVVTGGIARAVGIALTGLPDRTMLLALIMELAVTPLLCLWQRRVARQA